MTDVSELIERLGSPADVRADAWTICQDAKAALQSLSERLQQPTLHMVQAALEEARRHDPPLLPPCKELWAAELIWCAMASALTKEGIKNV